MRNIWWITKREAAYYLKTPIGFVIVTMVLVAEGLLFNAFAVGSGQQKSTVIVENFFYLASGVNMVACIFIAMRLIAEEKQNGTLVLLMTSPVREYQIVVGKFLAAILFVSVLNILTVYMPMLILLNGKISVGHLAAGYLGLTLLAGTCLALGMLCSALSPNQLVAAIAGAVVVVVFLLFWLLSKIASSPVSDILEYLSIHNKHFSPFQRGLVSLQDVVFYVSMIYVALLMSTRVLEASRWR